MNDGSRWTSHRRYLYLLAKALFFGLFLYTGYWLTARLSDVVLPLALSFLVAYLLDPVVDWFEAKGINRTLAIFFIMFIGLGAVTLFVFIVGPPLVDEISVLYTEKLPNLGRQVTRWYGSAQSFLQERTGYTLPKTLTETVNNYGQRALEGITASIQQIFERVTSLTTELLSGTWAVLAYLFNVLLVPLFIFYYLRDFDRIKGEFLELIPLEHRERTLARARRVDGVVGHWFRGQVTVAGILSVLYSVGLMICDVKLGLAIGIFAGVMSIIPYLGFVIGIGLALLMSLLDDGAGWGQVFGILAVFTIVQTAEGYIITPKIVGEKVGLSPLMVIIVLLVGAELFGFLGVLLAIPVAAVLRVFMLEAIGEYKRSRTFLGEARYLKLLAEGAGTADAEVREALRQAAEATLDISLPSPLTTQELNRLALRGDARAPSPKPDPEPPEEE
jgi:predicted PurR-regulated permease PerM